MNTQPVIVERSYNASTQTVWQALTDPAKMRQWYFDLKDFKPEIGFKFEFYGGTEEMSFLHLCEVTEVIPCKKLTYSWRYDGYPGKSFVTFELFPEGNNTHLKLTHTGLETFPQDSNHFARTNFEGGWNAIINTNLKEYLEK